ncbi:DinB family protein [Nocardia sp. NPDC023988]|uniref:DinB family protein n=1 Tax=unclassified Nocardia TaxID=2637762 RepID=UPI0033D6C0DD
MSTSRSELLRWQFDLVWSLFEYHLERLHEEDFLWEPSALCWTMREDPAGGWVADWANTEPDPIPVPTIGWLTWHIGWWWSVAIDHLRQRAPRERTDIAWPGPGDSTIEWLRRLRQEWLDTLSELDDADFDLPSRYPWPADAGLTVAHLVGWVDAELMKNVAEIGQLRLQRAVRDAVS